MQHAKPANTQLATRRGLVGTLATLLFFVPYAYAQDAGRKTPPPKSSPTKEVPVYGDSTSPLAALEHCDKGCIVKVNKKWHCVTPAETEKPPYEGHGSICKGP